MPSHSYVYKDRSHTLKIRKLDNCWVLIHTVKKITVGNGIKEERKKSSLCWELARQSHLDYGVLLLNIIVSWHTNMG